jgi:dicarboxylate/amino acid:cation (Na+ or H+) symporter, DAACS family
LCWELLSDPSLALKVKLLNLLEPFFLNLVNMVVVLLILSSIVVGTTSIQDPHKLGRIGLKTLLMYILTTIVSVSIGIFFSKVFALGTGLNLQGEGSAAASDSPYKFFDILISIIPQNPILALAEGNMIQIIVFSLFLGISINFSKEKGKPLLQFFESLSDVVNRS